jgi:hypothetical protein
MDGPDQTDAQWRVPDQALQPLAALFPTVAVPDVQAALAVIPLDTSRKLDNGETLRPPDYFSQEILPITWQGTLVSLPYRVYVREPAPAALQHLTTRQQQVLHCLYLRHYDGYRRQHHLEALLDLGAGAPPDFTTPFTFSLLGEYVQEILEVLAASLTPALLASYVALIKENPLYWQQTQGRVASYWDVYYRRGRRGTPRFRYYVGARLLAQLRQALPPAAGS